MTYVRHVRERLVMKSIFKDLHVVLDSSFEVFGSDELVQHEKNGSALAVGDLVEDLRNLGRVVKRLFNLEQDETH